MPSFLYCTLSIGVSGEGREVTERMLTWPSLSSGRRVIEEATVEDVRGPTLVEPKEVGGSKMGNLRWERSQE